MICTSIQHKTYTQILDALNAPEVEMAEIRLDLCKLSDEEIEDLFGCSDTPLVATCRHGLVSWEEVERRLSVAISAGARFADLEIEAPASLSKRFQKLCRVNGTEIIRSFHDSDGTPGDEVLHMALARCFRYGADIAKIVTTCSTPAEARRLQALYAIVLEGIDSMQGRLIAFGMGEAGRMSRLECLRRGAPFTYACLCESEATAPGQWTAAAIQKAVYGEVRPFHVSGLRMPASKSFAQRAIIAAALSEGTSRLGGYTPCADSESAVRVAELLGAKVSRDGDVLEITGCAPTSLSLDSLDVGESGLLTRLMIPLMSVLNETPVTVEGCGTLLQRPLDEAGGIMAAFGVLLANASAARKDARELYVPVQVRGRMIPGNADVSGKGGSQLISGLLMALPLCARDSFLFVSEPKSIPYMYITLDVLRHFGISTRSEMEGDAEMLENEDWSCCTGISFRIHGGQRYKPASFDIEGDWSAAANFLVAGAVFGSAEILGLDMKSLQADLSIIDILVDAGAVVSQVEDEVCVRKAPLEAFETDLNHAPDLFPIVSVLAAFCAGESRIAGIGRLAGKESDRAGAVLQMLRQMGVEASVKGDCLVVEGETLASRALCGRLLRGGQYTSRHDHRMVMALKVASLGADSPVLIDDEDCVGKSYPGFSLA